MPRPKDEQIDRETAENVFISIGEKTYGLIHQLSVELKLSKQLTGVYVLEEFQKNKKYQEEFQQYVLSYLPPGKEYMPPPLLESSTGYAHHLYLTKELKNYLESVFWIYRFGNKTQFYKYLIYFFYEKVSGVNVKSEIFKRA